MQSSIPRSVQGAWLLIWPGLALAEGAPLPFKTEDTGSLPWSAMAMLTVLALVLLWALAGAWRRRVMGQAAKPRMLFNWLPMATADAAITIVATRRLAGRVSLHVIEWEGGRVLLAVNDQQLVCLGNHPLAPNVFSQEPAS